MKTEDKFELERLQRQQEREDKIQEYEYDIRVFFRNLFRTVEIKKETIKGEETWIDYVLLTIISFNGKLTIDKELETTIYCCTFQKDGYYKTYTERIIYVEYEDKCYEINPEWGNYERGTENLVFYCDVYVYDKKDFKLKFDSIEKYYKHSHCNQELLDKTSYTTYKLVLNNDTNIITEIIKRVKEDRSRTHKK